MLVCCICVRTVIILNYFHYNLVPLSTNECDVSRTTALYVGVKGQGHSHLKSLKKVWMSEEFLVPIHQLFTRTLSFSPRNYKFGCKPISDWLNCQISEIRVRTFKEWFVNNGYCSSQACTVDKRLVP